MNRVVKAGPCECEPLLKSLREELRSLLKDKRASDYRVAVIVHQIWKQKLWNGGYSSFTKFVERELDGMSRHMAQKYVSIIENGVTEEQFKRVGASKLVTLLWAPPALRTRLTKIAHQISRAEIQDRIRKERGHCEPITEARITIVGPLAESIIRLAGMMGVAPEKYLELMVSSRTQPSRKRAA